MTANEMKYNLLLFYDKLFEYGSPSYDDRQISAILTKAQMRVFKKRYMPTENKYGQGFESTEERRTDLEQFIKNDSPSEASDQTGAHPNGVFYDMPTDFLYAVEESLITTASTPNEITVIPVRHDEYRANINNPYKKPYANLAWRMDYSRETHADGTDSATPKRTEIIVDASTTISSYRVRYLQSPPDIVCDEIVPANQKHCILDSTLHDEIVDEAVQIVVAATMPQKYNIATAEQQENES